MKKGWLLPIILVLLFSILSGCSNAKTVGTSTASWAYPFVVWNGYTYNPSNEYIDVDNIEKEIGEVTVYSDIEGNYDGNFSNFYKKGTKYYSIKGIGTDTAIAIKEEDGRYKKAIRDKKNGRK